MGKRRLRVFENRMLKKIPRPQKKEVKKSVEKYIMRRLIICTAHPILFG
jgi:hypothetical protein